MTVFWGRQDGLMFKKLCYDVTLLICILPQNRLRNTCYHLFLQRYYRDMIFLSMYCYENKEIKLITQFLAHLKCLLNHREIFMKTGLNR